MNTAIQIGSDTKRLDSPASFQINVTAGRLLLGGTPIDLPPKAFSVLRYLTERAGQLVTKEELLREIWSDVNVEEAVLKVAVCQIRRALDDPSREPRFIETAHRRGYRFIGNVEPAPNVTMAARSAGNGPVRIISEGEATLAKEASRVLLSRLRGGGLLQLRVGDDPSLGAVKLPATAVRLLVRLLDEMALGNAVTVETEAEFVNPEAA
jgi:DNA-binding winged helix-turn-helix (wHTH) protein